LEERSVDAEFGDFLRFTIKEESMGVVNFGIPIEEANYLREIMSLGVAVEGGTYRGGTAKKLGKLFDKVYTIEKSEQLFGVAKKNLTGISNIKLLKGDTRTSLPGILNSEDGILFWLDAHWSGGETYGEQDECPLIEELELIFNSKKKCAILIDDARLFMAPPPAPHDESVWPSIVDITAVLPSDWDLIIWNDVIYITVSKIRFRRHMQTRTTSEWLNFPNSKKINFKKRLRSMFRFAFRK
jgi:hypothetical protein